jgi:hypothetical protein
VKQYFEQQYYFEHREFHFWPFDREGNWGTAEQILDQNTLKEKELKAFQQILARAGLSLHPQDVVERLQRSESLSPTTVRGVISWVRSGAPVGLNPAEAVDSFAQHLAAQYRGTLKDDELLSLAQTTASNNITLLQFLSTGESPLEELELSYSSSSTTVVTRNELLRKHCATDEALQELLDTAFTHTGWNKAVSRAFYELHTTLPGAALLDGLLTSESKRFAVYQRIESELHLVFEACEKSWFMSEQTKNRLGHSLDLIQRLAAFDPEYGQELLKKIVQNEETMSSLCSIAMFENALNRTIVAVSFAGVHHPPPELSSSTDENSLYDPEKAQLRAERRYPVYLMHPDLEAATHPLLKDLVSELKTACSSMLPMERLPDESARSDRQPGELDRMRSTALALPASALSIEEQHILSPLCSAVDSVSMWKRGAMTDLTLKGSLEKTGVVRLSDRTDRVVTAGGSYLFFKHRIEQKRNLSLRQEAPILDPDGFIATWRRIINQEPPPEEKSDGIAQPAPPQPAPGHGEGKGKRDRKEDLGSWTQRRGIHPSISPPKSKRGARPILQTSRPLSGPHAYLPKEFCDGYNREYCQHLAATGAETRAFLEGITRGLEKSGERVSLTIYNVRDGSTIPLPLGSHYVEDSLLCALPWARLERNDDFTLRLRCGGGTGSVEVECELIKPQKPGEASIDTVASAVPEHLRANLTRPLSRLDQLPEELQQAIHTVRRMNAGEAATFLEKFVQQNYTYDSSAGALTPFREFLQSLPLTDPDGTEYQRVIHEMAGGAETLGRGICGQINTILGAEALRHAGIPSYIVSGVHAGGSGPVTANNLHAFVVSLQLNSEGQLFLKEYEGTSADVASLIDSFDGANGEQGCGFRATGVWANNSQQPETSRYHPVWNLYQQELKEAGFTRLTLRDARILHQLVGFAEARRSERSNHPISDREIRGITSYFRKSSDEPDGWKIMNIESYLTSPSVLETVCSICDSEHCKLSKRQRRIVDFFVEKAEEVYARVNRRFLALEGEDPFGEG